MDRILYLKKMVEASKGKAGDTRYGFRYLSWSLFRTCQNGAAKLWRND